MIADEYAKSQQSSTTSSGPLAGVPISVKDSENVKGYDSTISFSAWTRKPHAQDSPLVAFLRAAGASIHVKTSVPTTLITCETESELFGRTSNPYNAKYSPGASSGGGGALVAYGGTVIDIGTDLGGSVRCPSHFCGLYTVKGSTGRFLSPSGVSPIVGMEAVNLVAAPIARRLDDLEEMWKRVMSLEPWKVDRNVRK
jgi:Asp-tRNA(Asn)/Glu-tRNA(Gln) amidotransferase A subunit family amidase